MPIPGPRTQFGQLPGYVNPGGYKPDRFNHWNEHGPIAVLGESPGLMVMSRRGGVLAWGQIRKLWQQSVNVIPAQAPYSWTTNSPQPGRLEVGYDAFQLTRAVRYMTRSLYQRAGNDNTRFSELHTVYPKFNRYKTVTTAVGNAPGRPTTRNRITSFGTRVPVLNPQLTSAEGSGS